MTRHEDGLYVARVGTERPRDVVLVRRDDKWFAALDNAEWVLSSDTEASPAVVLCARDPHIRDFAKSYADGIGDDLVPYVANQINSQLAKLKPIEPTEFGAMVKDRAGASWVLLGDGQWFRDVSYMMRDYDEIDVVEVIRGGVS